ncbi:hypothetical protein TNCV_411411 [Trichonephila clavipes]|nr:hypothetical protein TNCV_411411 [Trichonephila clavipes]
MSHIEPYSLPFGYQRIHILVEYFTKSEKFGPNLSLCLRCYADDVASSAIKYTCQKACRTFPIRFIKLESRDNRGFDFEYEVHIPSTTHNDDMDTDSLDEDS